MAGREIEICTPIRLLLHVRVPGRLVRDNGVISEEKLNAKTRERKERGKQKARKK